MSANKAIISQLWAAYKHTPVKVKIMDLYLVYVLLTGVAQFMYCMLVGTFPFNSFLSGFISTVGCFVLTVGLRMQSDTEGKLKWNDSILPERAFADWLCANLILHVACFCFMMAEKKKLELYTPEYYAYCGLGGILSCGLTHTAVTPIDLLKCRKQVGIKTSFGEIAAKDGVRGLFLGWGPTLIGYSLQGLFKFGLYEVFKHTFMEAAGAENAKNYKDLLWLSASASAEVIADMALCPWEAVKVRIQTSNPENRTFPTTLREGMPQIVAKEGLGGLYKGLAPLWGRQVPYTMMKFWAFERTVEAIYKYVMPKPRAECSKVEQLGVTAASGYIAGVFCAVVSHPADSVISKLNQYETSPGIGAILSELGPTGIWRGLGLRIFMVGTLTCLQWFIYDSFKVSVGFPAAGSAAPAPVAPVVPVKKD